VVCGNAQRVPRTELEERIFGAIRERILVPEMVLYTVERALVLVDAGLRDRADRLDHHHLRDDGRLDEIEEELATLRRMAERGRAPAVAPLMAELEQERAELLAAPAPQGIAGVNVSAIRPLVEARVLEMREAFEGSPEKRRDAFRALLGDRRMRVYPDPDRCFRIEGLFELALETPTARLPDGLRAVGFTGSGGGRYARD